jgi:hypothetical protein
VTRDASGEAARREFRGKVKPNPAMIRVLIILLSIVSCVAAQSTVTAPVGNFPALNVQVTVGTLARPQKMPGPGILKSMTIHPKVTIEGVTRGTPIPSAESIMLTVTMDTGGTENVHSFEKLTIPAVQTGDRREFNYTESHFSFNGGGGRTYKYYVFALRDPVTKEIIDFKSNNVKLLSLCKEHPEKRDQFLNLWAGAGLPPLK